MKKVHIENEKITNENMSITMTSLFHSHISMNSSISLDSNFLFQKYFANIILVLLFKMSGELSTEELMVLNCGVGEDF